MMFIFVLVYLCIKILMTSSFVCPTLNLGRKMSTGTEPKDKVKVTCQLKEHISGACMPNMKSIYFTVRKL